jgi:hypothetical protein
MEIAMNDAITLDFLVLHAVPTGKVAHTLLLAIRRLAAGGLSDAHAANIFISDFGLGYRRPLVFLRVLLGEISRVSQRQIAVAPCCCPRMTAGEAAFLLMIESARINPELTRSVLARMTGTLDCLPAISIAQALGDALDDIGHPLTL